MTSTNELKGFGLGLRPPHYSDILTGDPAVAGAVDWFEIISENFMGVGGPPRRNLEAVRQNYPVVMHGVSLSIGAPEPLDQDYLAGLKELMDWLQPAFVSDHVCWTGAHGINLHDLLPLPMTEEAIDHVAARVSQVQDVLGRQILLENASTYVTFDCDAMPEWEFVRAIAEKADCGILLDVNNVYVSSFNHGFDPMTYLDHIPAERIGYIHLAGHENNGDHIIDTHDAPVVDAVWDLYAKAVAKLGPKPTMIERDDNIPAFAELVTELQEARRLSEQAVRAEGDSL